MARGRVRWVVAACAALAVLAAACEEQPAEDQEDQDPIEEDEGPEPDEDAGAGGAEANEAAAEGDAQPADEDAQPADDDAQPADDDAQPAEGDTIVDVLADHSPGAEDQAPEPGEQEAVDEGAGEQASEEPRASYLSSLDVVQAVQVEELLVSEGPFTLFAPTDQAFGFLPEDTFDGLLEEPERLEAVALYHVVEGELLVADLTPGDTLEAMSGHELRVSTTEAGDITVGGARLVDEDLQADNGVVHGIGAVLLPPQA